MNYVPMIRDKLAHEITQIAKTVLPPFAGDEWLNLNLGDFQKIIYQ
jgi:hypothetical protein